MVTWMPCCPACSSCLVNKTKRDQYTVKKRVRLGSGCVIYATQPKPLLLRCFLFLFVLLTERVEQATWKKWQELDAFSLSRRTLRQFRAIFLLQQKVLWWDETVLVGDSHVFMLRNFRFPFRRQRFWVHFADYKF